MLIKGNDEFELIYHEKAERADLKTNLLALENSLYDVSSGFQTMDYYFKQKFLGINKPF